MLEQILKFSLRQRFIVIVAVLAAVGYGVLSWSRVTLDVLPDITTNQVAINTNTGGMSPEEVEKLVTFPVETAMGGIPGVEHIRSLSQYGLSQVTVTFEDSVDLYFARTQVAERLGNVKEELPEGVPAPQMGPISTGLGDIYTYALESESRTILDLRTIQDWQIAPQLRTVPGVAEVNAADGSVKQFQVEVNPQALLARNIPMGQVVEALQSNNQNAGGGVLEKDGERIMVRSIGLVQNASDIEQIVVKSDGGIPVLVRDIATVKIGIPTLTGISSKDGKEALTVTVMTLKGANGRTVSDAVDAKISEIRDQLPEDVVLTTVYNRSDLVNQTLSTVRTNLVEGGLLVLAVLLLLLGNLRVALIVALAIPLSMVFAVIGMSQFGISGNLMSLGAIDFGLIVDGAVVMVENALRRVAEARALEGSALDRREVRHSVWESSREVAKPTVFAVTIITVVYLPILALEGTEGKMFRPMAFTVVFALLGALALTITLVPALTSLLLSGDTTEKRNRAMDFAKRLYNPTLAWALAHRAFMVTGGIATVLLAGYLFTRMGSEFIPQLDEGSIVVQPVRPRTVDSAQTVRLVTATERVLGEVPEVTTVFSRSGTPDIATDPMPLSITDTFVMLKPRNEWRPGLTKAKLIEEMQNKLEDVPGQGYSFTQPVQLRFAELISGVKADVGIKVFGDDLAGLKAAADRIAAVVREVPGAEDVEVEQVDEVPILTLSINRMAISRLGIHVDDIQEVIRVALAGEPIGQILEGDKRFDLTVRFPEYVRNDPKQIGQIWIGTPDGGAVQLSSLADIRIVPAPAQISREMGKRRVVVQLNVRGRDLGSFVEEAKRSIQKEVPPDEGTYVTWGGQFENLEQASARLAVVVPIALLLILALLFVTFGSIRQALLVFTGVPLAATGGIFALAVRGMPFSISAGVGFIALSGVAVLNGVVLVSAINRIRSETGCDVEQAVRQGASLRLRPVLMTALVAALGFIPMALNTGMGAEVQRPLATVVIGGIVSATLLTMILLPVLFVLFERNKTSETEM